MKVLSKNDEWEQAKEMSVKGLDQGEIITVADWDSTGDYILAGTNKVTFLVGLANFSHNFVGKSLPNCISFYVLS